MPPGAGLQPWGTDCQLVPMSAEAEGGGTTSGWHSQDTGPDLPTLNLWSHSLSWVFVEAVGLGQVQGMERLARGLCCLW